MNQPDFVIGVEQQPQELIDQWKRMGCNTLVNLPQGRDPVEYVKAANAAGMYQIRPPVGDAAVDAGNPLLLAWSFPDEPDLKGISAKTLALIRTTCAAADVVRKIPWMLNLSGGLVNAFVKPAPTQADYQALMANADWICSDLYPVSGWDGAIDLFSVGRTIDTLRAWDGTHKPQLAYVECSRQGLGNLPNGGRCVTAAEFKLLIHQVRSRAMRGLIYFPLQPDKTFSPFKWDASPAEIKVEMLAANQMLD